MNRHRELAQMMRAAAAPPAGIPTDGLYHWLKLDQETGSTILNYGTNGEAASVRVFNNALHTTGWRFDAILERWVYYADDADYQNLRLPSFALPFPVTMVFHVKSNSLSLRKYAYDQESPRTIVTISNTDPATTVEIYDGTWRSAGVEQLAEDVWGQQAVFMTENSLQVVNDNGNGDVIATSSVGTGITIRALFGKYSGSLDNNPNAFCADFLLYSRILSAGELAAIRVAVLGS